MPTLVLLPTLCIYGKTRLPSSIGIEPICDGSGKDRKTGLLLRLKGLFTYAQKRQFWHFRLYCMKIKASDYKSNTILFYTNLAFACKTDTLGSLYSHKLFSYIQFRHYAITGRINYGVIHRNHRVYSME